MTWKKFWKRVNALFHDNRTVLREGENIEDWEDVQRKQREAEAMLPFSLVTRRRI